MPRGAAGDQFAQRQHLVRIEGHADRRAGIGGEHLRHPLHQPAVAVEMAFDLDHQRHAAGDERAEIAERHHPLRRILERDRLQFGRGLAEQRAGTLGEAAERIVMMHHRLAVGR